MPDSIGWGVPGVHNEIAGDIYANSVPRDARDPLGRAGLSEPGNGPFALGVILFIVGLWTFVPSGDLAARVIGGLLGLAAVTLLFGGLIRRRRWKRRVAAFVEQSEHGSA